MNKYLVLLLVAIFAPGLVKAQNYNDALRLSLTGLGSNARALGMGNAYMSISNDYSANFFNPAGLALVKRMEISGGIGYSKFSNDATLFGNNVSYSNSTTDLNQFNFTFPFPTIRGSMVFGFGYNRDVDFNGALSFKGYNGLENSMIQALLGKNDVSYLLYLTDDTGLNTPINKGNLQQDGTVLSSGGIGKWAFTGAVEVAKDVFLGGTLNIYSGDYKRTRDYYEEDINNVYGSQVQTDPMRADTKDFQLFSFNEVLKWELSGWDAKIGLLYKLEKMGRVGLSIKLPTSFTIKENYTVNGQSKFGTGKTFTIDPPLESEVEYKISSPFVFSGGASFDYKGLTLSGDLHYIDYSQIEFTDGLPAQKMSNNNRDIKELLDGKVNYNLGLEYTVPDVNLRLRGGFMMNASAFKNDPSSFDKKFITGGVGFLTEETLALDVAFIHGWWQDMGDNYGSNVSRTYQDITYNNFVFSVSYRF